MRWSSHSTPMRHAAWMPRRRARGSIVTVRMRWFVNVWLWAAIAGSIVLQILVVHVPLLQRAFGTADLAVRDWVFCAVVASSVLWLRELSKLATRALANRHQKPASAPARA